MFTCSGCRSAAASTATRAPTPSPRRLQRSRRRASQWMSRQVRPLRGRQSGLWPWATAPHSALNMHQLHAGHWSGSGHKNISAGSERTPPRNASSAQTIPALRAGVSRVVRRKAPSVASFFGARPLGELWDDAFCGSAPSFPVRRRTVSSEVAQFITCCKCKTFLEVHSY